MNTDTDTEAPIPFVPDVVTVTDGYGRVVQIYPSRSPFAQTLAELADPQLDADEHLPHLDNVLDDLDDLVPLLRAIRVRGGDDEHHAHIVNRASTLAVEAASTLLAYAVALRNGHAS